MKRDVSKYILAVKIYCIAYGTRILEQLKSAVINYDEHWMLLGSITKKEL